VELSLTSERIMLDNTKYIIYRITNRINSKIYIGKHQTTNINDGYFGSGIAISAAIKKYGKENFNKEMLFIFDSEIKMNQKEKEIVTEEFIKRNNTYNLGLGGQGGPQFKGRSHSRISIEKMLESRKSYSPSVETKKKISEANSRRIISSNTRKKLSISAYMRQSRSLEEACQLYESSILTSKKPKMSNSDARKIYFSNIENRKKLSEKMQKLRYIFDFNAIEADLYNKLKPKEIQQKHKLTKNQYDRIRAKYIKK
jgi:hypothetical protein